LFFLDNVCQNASAPIDDYVSLVWTRKYFDCGNFQLVLNAKYYDTVSAAEYLYNNGESGQIENINIKDKQVTVKGRLLESLLDRIVIYTTINLYGNLEDGIKTIIEGYTGWTVVTNGFTETVSTQQTGGTLMEWLYELLKPFEMSFRVWYDYDASVIKFTLVKGLDRTQDQSTNSRAIFSTTFENVKSLEYANSVADYKNYAYVAGEEIESTDDPTISVDSNTLVIADTAASPVFTVSDTTLSITSANADYTLFDFSGTTLYIIQSNRVIVIVDNVQSGESRRELWVDARDLQSDDITLAEYKNTLTQRGLEKLAEYPKTQAVNVDVDQHSTPIYATDYDVGDICDITSPDINLRLSARLTQAEEVYEDSGYKVALTFGEDYLQLKDYIKRESGK